MKTDARKEFGYALTQGPVAEALAGSKPQALAVGFSGGADSALLTVLMQEYCRELSLPLYAVHVHHGIRGAEADRDAAFCEEFCRARGIPVTVVRADAPALAERERIGLEAAARRVRYDAFRSFLQTLGRPALLATAHNADDNLETVLFHLVRGSGLGGMCGIPPVRLPFIRPLLTVTSAEIRRTCAAEGIRYVVDSTNADPAYTRNYLRTTVVPALRALNPETATAVSRMSTLLREDEEALSVAAETLLGDFAGGTSAPLTLLADQPSAILSRAVARLYANANGSPTDLTAEHVRAMTAFLREGKTGCFSLPHGVTARIAGGLLSMEPPGGAPAVPPADFEHALGEGESHFPAYGFTIRTEPAEAGGSAPDGVTKNIYNSSISVLLSSVIMKKRIVLRFRRAGDTIRYGGITRDVRKLYNEAHIPPPLRATLPVLADEDGIVWIPGFPPRDGTAAEPPFVRITYARGTAEAATPDESEK